MDFSAVDCFGDSNGWCCAFICNNGFKQPRCVNREAGYSECNESCRNGTSLERMPRPIGEQLEETEEGEIRTPAFRFNGQELNLNYPKASNVVVRIYDHAGKININRIPRRNMQLLIEKRLGGQDADPAEVQDLLAAWTDWTDLNDLEGLNGAESDYYRGLDQSYSPRNNPELDTVEELLYIRGFAELFEGVNLQAAFTIYGMLER